ncbi:MAG: SH3 domain-containing protein [Xenococcaceae cyanobacterium MO_207.B15]|nr:SH3 domain-containing protein [Xenococcaceae cyanobacterium MO_207.B15]
MLTNKPIWQTSLKVIYNISQFVLGFILGISIIGVVAGSAGLYYFARMSYVLPKKPVYEEETAPKTEIVIETPEESLTVSEDIPIFPPEPEPEPEPIEPAIPENAYFAVVTWPQGLSLRAEPTINSARIGGIAYNTKILILEESSDKKWQRVRLLGNQQEGWVKGGNTKKASY